MTADVNPVSSKPMDKVLLNAWRRLLDYDRVSFHQKRNFVEKRRLVIALTFTASLAAAMGSFFTDTFIGIPLALVAFILPFVAIWALNDAMKFAGSTTWIRCRVAAERIRSSIYLYRMRAGAYHQQPPHLHDDLLLREIEKADAEVQGSVDIPFMSPQVSEAEMLEKIKLAMTYIAGDDGLRVPTFEQYVEWRVTSPINWYTHTIQFDYAAMKRQYRLSQVLTSVGALISAIAAFTETRLLIFSVIMNSASVALTAWSNVGMFGKTYSLFQAAAIKLENRLNLWYATKDNPELENQEALLAERVKMVNDIEKILEEERRAWAELAVQTQTANDQTIINALEQLSKQRSR